MRFLRSEAESSLFDLKRRENIRKQLNIPWWLLLEKVTLHRLHGVFTFIYIFCKCQNFSIKLSSALLFVSSISRPLHFIDKNFSYIYIYIYTFKLQLKSKSREIGTTML